MQAVVAVGSSQNFIQQHADSDDAAFARHAQASHEHYQKATQRLLEAVAASQRVRPRS